MIKSIILKGFMSHVDTVIDLSLGLTVITGPSDSGKTAIIDAVRWVAFNEPSGEAYVNKNTGNAFVQIDLIDGRSVSKARRKGKTVHTVSGIEAPFEKSETPAELTEVLNIVKQHFGDFVTALNFAYQLDAPFLLSETPSAGAKILGKIAGTEAVDLAIKDTSKDTYAARQLRSKAEQAIEDIDASLGAFIDLHDQQRAIEYVQQVMQQCEEDGQRIEYLRELKDRYDRANSTLTFAKGKAAQLYWVPIHTAQLEDIQAQASHKGNYLRLVDAHNMYNQQLETAKRRLSSMPDLEKLAAHLAHIQGLRDTSGTLDQNRLDFVRLSNVVIKAQETMERTAGITATAGLLHTVERVQERLATLQTLATSYKGWSVQLEEIRAAANKAEEKLAVQQQVDHLQELTENLRALEHLQQTYAQKATDTALARRKVEGGIKLLEEAKTSLASSWGDLTACPLCEQPIENH